MNATTITAKYDGKCACGGTISTGDRVLFDGKIVGCPACKPDSISYDRSYRMSRNMTGFTTHGQAVRGHAGTIAALIVGIERWEGNVANAVDPIKRAKYQATLDARRAELPAYIAKLAKRDHPTEQDIALALSEKRAEIAKREQEEAEAAL